MESLAWRSRSQLWEAIQVSGQGIPKFEDTALPGHILYVQTSKKVQNPEVTSSNFVYFKYIFIILVNIKGKFGKENQDIFILKCIWPSSE